MGKVILGFVVLILAAIGALYIYASQLDAPVRPVEEVIDVR